MMKLLLISGVVIAGLSSCKKINRKQAVESPSEQTLLTAEDVAWATGWSITKLNIGEIGAEKYNQVEWVIIDAEGDMTTIGHVLGENNDLRFQPDEILRFAVNNDQGKAFLRLNIDGMSSINTTEAFKSWSWISSRGKKIKIHNDLLFVASDGFLSSDIEKTLKAKCNKLCLRFSKNDKPEKTQSNSN